MLLIFSLRPSCLCGDILLFIFVGQPKRSVAGGTKALIHSFPFFILFAEFSLRVMPDTLRLVRPTGDWRFPGNMEFVTWKAQRTRSFTGFSLCFNVFVVTSYFFFGECACVLCALCASVVKLFFKLVEYVIYSR